MPLAVWRFKERQCNVSAVWIVLGIQKCILIALPLLSMCRQAILLNVVSASILQYWFSSSPSFMHGFMIASFLGQYSIIKSSVSATIAHWSLLCYVKYTFSELVSFRPSNALLCVLFHEGYLWLHSILTDLDSSLKILRFAFFISGVVLVCVWCLVHIGMLAVVGFVAFIVFRAVNAPWVACWKSSSLAILFAWTLSYRRAHLPVFFFRPGMSKGDLTLLLMCWLTVLGVSWC